MSSQSGSRKPVYRWHRVKCNECQTEMNADHANTQWKENAVSFIGRCLNITVTWIFVSNNATLPEPSSPVASSSNANDNSTFIDKEAGDESQHGMSIIILRQT